MGGDGGVVATNRRYMRGAGTADHTGDVRRGGDHASESEAALEVMTTCALSKAPLRDSATSLVACPYGRIYHREAAIRALLRRKTHETDELGSHVRGRSDLYEVRLHYDSPESKVASCPVTGKALKGTIPAILLVPGHPESPNVVSESALSQLPPDEFESEYGSVERKVRLAPPVKQLEEIKIKVSEEHKQDALKRKEKKSNKKKRKHSVEDQRNVKKTASSSDKAKDTRKSTTKAVGSSVVSSSVLSDLFSTNSREISEKEKKDNLFAR